MKFQTLMTNEKSTNIYFERIACSGAKKAMIFIHGLAGSRRNWGDEYSVFAKKHSLYFIDLLGYGYSAKPQAEYTLERHVEALQTFVDKNVKEPSIVLVGHSLGAILALGYMHAHPKQVSRVFALSLPYYLSEKDAKQYIRSSEFPSSFFTDTVWLRIFCNTVCRFGGPLSRRLMPHFLRHLPPNAVSDSFLHTYNSYISTLYHVIYQQDIPSLLEAADTSRIHLIHADHDRIAPLSNVELLAKQYPLDLTILGDQSHLFPLLSPRLTVKTLQNLME